MQHNYSSECETSGLSEDLLVLWQLAGGSMAREMSRLCARCTQYASVKTACGTGEVLLGDQRHCLYIAKDFLRALRAETSKDASQGDLFCIRENSCFKI